MNKLTNRFVEFIPEKIETGLLYISMEYGTIIHLCPCGCQNKVVIRIAPDGWRMSYDGENVSLFPSIGNWRFPCSSHYWIIKGEIVWDGTWSKKKVRASFGLPHQKKEKKKKKD